MDFPSVGCESSLRAPSQAWENNTVDPEPGRITLWTFCSFFKTKEMVTCSSRAGVLGLGVILSFALRHITDISQLPFLFW